MYQIKSLSLFMTLNNFISLNNRDKADNIFCGYPNATFVVRGLGVEIEALDL